MPLYTDPSTVENTRYECLACGERVVRESHPVVCESCGGDVRRVTVPRN